MGIIKPVIRISRFYVYQTDSRAASAFSYIFLDEISNRNLSRWVEYERQRGIKDITIRLWSRQFNKICRNAAACWPSIPRVWRTVLGQHLWARGYWVVSSGNVADEVWKKYIKNQQPPEPDDDFTVV